MKSLLKKAMLGVACAAAFGAYCFALFNPHRPECRRTPVVLYGSIDGNGKVHDLHLNVNGHAVPCTMTKYDVVCPPADPVLSTLITTW